MLFAAASPALAATDGEMALIPAGSFTPFYSQKNAHSEKETVESFWLDKYPVTNGKFLEFASSHPQWGKTGAKRIFADSHYLQHRSGDLKSEKQNDLDRPVVNVSWFAASAYCENLGKRLPSTDEWEYALADNGRDQEKVQELFINWCATASNELPKVGSSAANGFGVFAMAGVISEWTSDFNSFMSPSDSRDSGEKNLFCGGGSIGAADPEDYAAFMRYSYRASLQGNFTGKNLGFRCAKDAK